MKLIKNFTNPSYANGIQFIRNTRQLSLIYNLKEKTRRLKSPSLENRNKYKFQRKNEIKELFFDVTNVFWFIRIKA